MYRWEVPTVLARRLAQIRDRTGWPVSRQLRRAVDEYLDQHEAGTGRATARVGRHTTTRGGSQG